MKRILFFAICISIMLFAGGCGKNNAVIEVEEMINSIGEITLDSGEELANIEMYYEALSEGQKDQVENHIILVKAIDEYNALVKKSQVISGVSKKVYERGCTILDNVLDFSMEMKIREYADSKENWQDTYDAMVADGIMLKLNINDDATMEEKTYKELIDTICKKYVYTCWSIDIMSTNPALAELVTEDIVNQSKLFNIADDVKNGKITDKTQMEELIKTVNEMAGS